MIDWYEAKQFFERATALSMDALHIVVGVLLLFGFALLLRRPVSDARPWLAVLAIALLNEAADLWLERWPSLGMQLGELVKDVAITMLLPTLVLLSARHLPQLYRPGRRQEIGAPPAGEA